VGLVDPQDQDAACRLGGSVLPGSPADFGKLIADETEKWAKVIRGTNPFSLSSAARTSKSPRS
jgi:hypothetical protein